MMLPNVQRAKVESKSQQVEDLVLNHIGCYQMYKELKLKANHNSYTLSATQRVMLPNVQRAKVESKSQLIHLISHATGDVTKCTKS